MSRPVAAVLTLKLASISLAALTLSACGMGSASLRGADGQLQPCGARHCVSSLSDDPTYAIEPLRYAGDRGVAHATLIGALKGMPGVAVATDTPDYVHATATTALMRYVDDMEFVFPADASVIQLRSSSRLGYSDLGANRKRIETLRERFMAAQPR
ncbi:DUF1499 domain-containing protein [Sinimarinibacterium sp. CAU 1509]|uniref:DUF1499 domain-containing protein n=1 Tax=Sinimarinibacterium sp. CAU 1509 TaxID=2562283 RepID=UPI0010AC2D27|nr:DUF1499 domain-containing protein [Sinimarinibacterium sp. CAU 1509]TJY63133.1 DUF1499 domain-containing protein [Sinimarinibacterium sp. CAU 1509]